MNLLHSISETPDHLTTIILPVFEGEDIQLLNRTFEPAGFSIPFYQPADFDGKKDEVLILYAPERERKFFLVGLGKDPGYAQIKKILSSFRKKYAAAISGEAGILIPSEDNPDGKTASAISNGWHLGEYDIGIYQTGKKEKNGIATVFLAASAAGHLEEHIRFGENLARVQKGILTLVNAPSNHKTPDELASWASRAARDERITLNILEKKDLEREGMHALLAVNRGSEVPAKCIIMDYNPGHAKQTIALVGKGVTFDTGGLSIKSRKNMHYMKSDMGGAGAVMGALVMAAKNDLPARVAAIVPCTDNSVDALSVKPGDVISSYSGKSIEIIDTDAEGRLILADGISYALKEFEPDHLIDAATLTGSVIQALGTQAAGLYTNHDALAEEIISAGQATGEKVWRLPVWEAYGEEMKSDIADIRNLGDKPYAGSITAAKFLQFFTNGHTSWAHLDIAGMAFGPNHLSRGYSATGYGIHLLYETIRRLSS